MRVVLFPSTALALVLASAAARADDPPMNPDVVVSESEHPKAIDRTWLFADDARIPAPLSVIATTSATYTGVSSDPFRPSGYYVPTKYSAFDSNTAQPGLLMSVGGELGIVSHVSFLAVAQLEVAGETSHPNPGGVVGLRFLLTPLSWSNLHIVASGGYLREAWEGPSFNDDNPTCVSGSQSSCWTPGNPNGDNGMWFQAAISGDVGRFRLVGNFHGEHVFADGRDPLDVMVDLGATYRVAGAFRAGLEWVGQDLEETFSPGAEGGARMFGGPIASYQALHNRLTIVGGPAIGVSQSSSGAPNYLGRLQASYGF